MTEDEKVDNRRSEEGDEGTIYIQPIETESMGLESDLPEDDQAVGEDLPDGFKKLIKTTVKAVACGLSQKTKEEDKTSYIQHVDMYEPAASNKHISQPIGTPTMVEEVDTENVHDLNLHMRGYMVLIVNRTFDKKSLRYGAENDLENMQNIAEKLGYKIHNTEYCENLNQSETMDVLQKARKADHSHCDSFAVMISTHGCEEPNSKAKGKMDHVLICADDKMIFTSTITEMFNDENCPTLKGKTKLFFIQACRGAVVISRGFINVRAKK
ncbi:caspase-12-like isoform X2 [Mya arenaria]|uniref:caspase-12-like isoform X2 n=1 Tax=Mya arenaria TaxID=6604 RepID=UPI0022DEB22C|nr:caspase-12-like isoform X2 [Mya arenaria]